MSSQPIENPRFAPGYGARILWKLSILAPKRPVPERRIRAFARAVESNGSALSGRIPDRKCHSKSLKILDSGPEMAIFRLPILRTIDSNRFVTGVTWVDHLGRRRERAQAGRPRNRQGSKCRAAWAYRGSSPTEGTASLARRKQRQRESRAPGKAKVWGGRPMSNFLRAPE
jgi:hypothetical protein